jgi:hypothetical protein
MAIETVAQLMSEVSLDIGDTELTDDQIRMFVHKAVVRLNRRLDAAGLSTVLAVDSNCNISFPDETLRDLVVLQAECLIAKRGHMEAVQKGIRIKSGSDEVDTTAGFNGHQSVVTNVCDELDEAFEQYVENAKESEHSDLIENYGTMIWYGEQRKYEDVDHDGQFAERKHPFDSAFDDEEAHDL